VWGAVLRGAQHRRPRPGRRQEIITAQGPLHAQYCFTPLASHRTGFYSPDPEHIRRVLRHAVMAVGTDSANCRPV
jgi:hypothetical protein